MRKILLTAMVASFGLAAEPLALTDVRPELVQVPAEAVRLQAQLPPEPPGRPNRAKGQGAEGWVGQACAAATPLITSRAVARLQCRRRKHESNVDTASLPVIGGIVIRGSAIRICSERGVCVRAAPESNYLGGRSEYRNTQSHEGTQQARCRPSARTGWKAALAR